MLSDHPASPVLLTSNGPQGATTKKSSLLFLSLHIHTFPQVFKTFSWTIYGLICKNWHDKPHIQRGLVIAFVGYLHPSFGMTMFPSETILSETRRSHICIHLCSRSHLPNSFPPIDAETSFYVTNKDVHLRRTRDFFPHPSAVTAHEALIYFFHFSLATISPIFIGANETAFFEKQRSPLGHHAQLKV